MKLDLSPIIKLDWSPITKLMNDMTIMMIRMISHLVTVPVEQLYPLEKKCISYRGKTCSLNTCYSRVHSMKCSVRGEVIFEGVLAIEGKNMIIKL